MRGHVKEAPAGIERRRLEVRAAVIVRKTVLRSAEIVEDDRPAGLVKLPRPVRVDERFTDQELARLTVDCVEEAVPIGHHDHFSGPTVDSQICEDRHVRRIPVVHVVGGELVVPPKLPAVGIERHERARVEIVAFPVVAVVIGVRIPGAEKYQIERGIVAA